MQKFFSQALCAALLMGACVTDAAVPTVQDASIVLRQTSAIYAQVGSFDHPVRYDLAKIFGPAGRVELLPRADETQDTNTGVMLLGALAIMGVMVRRRWNTRD